MHHPTLKHHPSPLGHVWELVGGRCRPARHNTPTGPVEVGEEVESEEDDDADAAQRRKVESSESDDSETSDTECSDSDLYLLV